MSISGLVITLRGLPDVAAESMGSLERDPRLTLGERFGNRVVAVAETPSVEADRALWDDLRAMPGVEYVDVTFVSIDATPPARESCDPTKENSHDHRE